MKPILAIGMLIAGVTAFGVQATPDLEGGTWRCQRTDTPNGVQEWTSYTFHTNGTITSQEWLRNKENNKVVLEFTLSVNYSYHNNGEEFVLRPIELARDITVDYYNIDPFNYDSRRDLLGYRIFFQPQFDGNDRAEFDMRHHITPEQPFSLSCTRKA
ncbi:hypothetical protein L4D09_22800 [Photobacterium makurazakiensis]|uniref:hypothetical protein n=1 Tax=Photobacterium makurazakiensis TaxID=2910234 RepID=UPI003D13634B